MAVQCPGSGKEEETKPLIERWRESEPRSQTRETALLLVFIGLLLLGIGLAAVWFFQVFQDYLHADLESLILTALDHRSNLQKTDSYLIAILIVVILSAAVNLCKRGTASYGLSQWIRRNRIGIEEELPALLSKKKADDDEKSVWKSINETREKETLKKACFLAVDPNRITFLAMIGIIPELFLLALNLFLCIEVKNFAAGFMDYKVSGYLSGGNFSWDWKTFLIWGAGLLVLWIVSDILCKKIANKNMESTLQKIAK